MKPVALPRLPDYQSLWHTAKTWRVTRELPELKTGKDVDAETGCRNQEVSSSAEEDNAQGSLHELAGQYSTQGQTEAMLQLPVLDAARPEGIQLHGRKTWGFEDGTARADRGLPLSARRHRRKPSSYTLMFNLGRDAHKYDQQREGVQQARNDELEAEGTTGGVCFQRPHSANGRLQRGRQSYAGSDAYERPAEEAPRIRLAPRLGIAVVRRRRVFLGPGGNVVVGNEEMLQLVESGPQCASPLRLRHVAEAQALMRSPLMPCLLNSHVRSHAELLRTRGKDWKDDPELSFIFERGLEDLVVGKRKRRYFEHGKLRLGTYPRETRAELGGSEITNKGELLHRERMAQYACMISHTHSIMTIHGVGIHGRIVGIPGKGGSRFMDVQVYTPHNCRRYSWRLHTDLLHTMFSMTNSNKHEVDVLKAGSKKRLLRELSRVLHFEYVITETFVVEDGYGTVEDKQTVYRHTEPWHIDPYRWSRRDEQKDDEVVGGTGVNVSGEVMVKRPRQSAAERRRIVDEEQRKERELEMLAASARQADTTLTDVKRGHSDEADVQLREMKEEELSHGLPTPALAVDTTVASSPGAADVGDSPPATSRNVTPEAVSTATVETFTESSDVNQSDDANSPTSSASTGTTSISANATAPVTEQDARIAAASTPPKERPKRRIAVTIEEYLCVDLVRQRPANMSEVRRIEARQRRQREMQEAIRKQQLWEKKPVKRRGLELGQWVNITGFESLVLAYVLPTMPTAVFVKVYDRRTCHTSTIKLEMVHMGRVLRLRKPPDKWSEDDKKRMLHGMRGELYYRPTEQPLDYDDVFPPPPGSTLCFDTKRSDTVPLLTLRPLQLGSRESRPFQPPPIVHACVPRQHWGREKAFRHRVESAIGFHEGLSARGLWTWKPRCRPRREVAWCVQGWRRMVSGAAKVDGTRCLFSCWWDQDIEGEGGGRVVLVVYVPEELRREEMGSCPACCTQRLSVALEDLGCASAGSGMFDHALALAGVADDELVVHLSSMKAAVIAQCDIELEELGAKLRAVKEEMEFAQTQGKDAEAADLENLLYETEALMTEKRGKRDALDEFERMMVMKAEDAWEGMARAVLGRSRWSSFELLEDAEPFEAIVGDLEPSSPDAERIEEHDEGDDDESGDEDMDGDKGGAELTASALSGAPSLVLRCSALIYRGVHRVKNFSSIRFHGTTWVSAIFSVYQISEALHIVAYTPTTCERFPFESDAKLHKLMITEFRSLSLVKRSLQLQIVVQDLGFHDITLQDGKVGTVLGPGDEEQPPEVEVEEEDFGDILAGLDSLLDAAAEEGSKSRARLAAMEQKAKEVRAKGRKGNADDEDEVVDSVTLDLASVEEEPQAED